MPVQFHIDTGDDGEAVTAIRALKAQLDAGLISRQQYDTGFAQINRATGVQCDRCSKPPAVFKHGTRLLCAACYQVEG